jgi:hypothetical protein
MPASTAPQAVAVEVAAAQPTESDSALISQMDAQGSAPLPGVAYLVKVKLKKVPQATSQGWALYVGDLRIPKYWAYEQGIYFKVFDPGFFEEHKGGKLRFSQDGSTFTDTGLKLGEPAAKRSRAAAQLPQQDELLR